MKNWQSFGLFICVLSSLGCRARPPAERLPTEKEANAEEVVANYGPRRLRVFPAQPNDAAPPLAPQGYLILASERPELAAVFRPLAFFAKKPPLGTLARAGAEVFVADHVVEAVAPGTPPGTRPINGAALRVYDRDGKVGIQVALTPKAACAEPLPPLLQSAGSRIRVLLRCPVEHQAILLSLDAAAQILPEEERVVAGADPAELFLHQPDADYLLSGRQVMRVGPEAHTLPTIGTVPPPGGDADTRELVRMGSLLLVVDGAAGRVIAMDALSMGWRFEKRFFTSSGQAGRVLRLRAALAAPDRLAIVTAEATPRGTKLFGTGLTLDAQASESPPRLFLGEPLSSAQSDHELVSIAQESGGGALLVYSHLGNSGPMVALRKLNL